MVVVGIWRSPSRRPRASSATATSDVVILAVIETRGREWDRVTFRSDSRVATVLEVMQVIEVPRSAYTTWGTPWMPKICFIISSASSPDSWAWTWAPTM